MQSQTASLIREELIKETKRLEEDAKNTSKEHFLVAARFNMLHVGLAGSSAVLAGIVGTSLMTKWDSQGSITGILSLVVLITTTLVLFLDPSKSSATSKLAGNEYNDLRGEARRFYSIDAKSDMTDAALREKLNFLCEKKSRANSCYPQPPEWSHKMAAKKLAAGESDYKEDSPDPNIHQ